MVTKLKVVSPHQIIFLKLDSFVEVVTEIYGFGDLGGEDRTRNEFAMLIVELGRLMAYDFLDRGGGWLFTLDIVLVEILNGEWI